MAYGTYYSVFMSDGTGFGNGQFYRRCTASPADLPQGGVIPVQMVQGGPSTCVADARYNASTEMFSANISGSTAECDSNFRVNWDGASQDGPYNMTVIPLDGGYTPYEVTLDGSQHYDWKVNMTQGSYFTVMLKWAIPSAVWNKLIVSATVSVTAMAALWASIKSTAGPPRAAPPKTGLWQLTMRCRPV
jgi:hypothetical protein